MTETITTCQICGRAIKAKKGLIAHHGYSRPGYGWQTASCPGAQYLPYEVSHGRLDGVILTIVNDWLPDALKAVDDLWSNPPETLKWRDRGYGNQRGQQYEAGRPEGFDRDYALRTYGGKGTYNGIYTRRMGEAKAHAQGMAQMLESLKERRAAWIAPEAAA